MTHTEQVWKIRIWNPFDTCKQSKICYLYTSVCIKYLYNELVENYLFLIIVDTVSNKNLFDDETFLIYGIKLQFSELLFLAVF